MEGLLEETELEVYGGYSVTDDLEGHEKKTLQCPEAFEETEVAEVVSRQRRERQARRERAARRALVLANMKNPNKKRVSQAVGMALDSGFTPSWRAVAEVTAR